MAENKRLLALMVAAAGIVYGDIGTSPLYALRECFHGPHAVEPAAANVLGVLSLIFWSLVIVISIKYLALIMRADNEGEGGILALMARVCPPEEESGKRRARALLVLLGLFGAALFYGDGMITPAISVLSAVEGLEVARPGLKPFVIPLAVAILIGLFLIQKRGTQRIGFLFGPVTLVWFACLAVLGIGEIARSPVVLEAVNPIHGFRFFVENGWRGFLVLGSVFLVVTGGEAVYADMGHFGKRPIRWVWFGVALPALLLNYFGQGALLLSHPEWAASPFYHLAPGWAQYPLIALATAATVIASQAVITGAFSLTWQAVQLGYLPRTNIRHTSEDEIGQIYVPSVNWTLLLATVALVLGFGSSSRLAAAYGVAVTSTMVITSVLAFIAMRRLWNWSLPAAVGVTGFFLAIELAFFAANIVKIADGGWFPLCVGAGFLLLMTTWRRGRRLLGERIRGQAVSMDALLEQLKRDPPARVPGVAAFLTGNPQFAPAALVRLLRNTRALHEGVLILHVVNVRRPRVPSDQRVEVEPLGDRPDLHRVTLRFGFMENLNVPRALARARERGLDVDMDRVTFVLGRETVLAGRGAGLSAWRERLFAFLSLNAERATEFYRLPPDRVLEIGAQIEL